MCCERTEKQHSKLLGLPNTLYIDSVVGIMIDVRDGQKLLKTCVGKGSPTGSLFYEKLLKKKT